MEESNSFNKDNNLVLYHGGSCKVEYPAIRKARYMKDFGFGFYTTVLETQAKKWSLRKSQSPTVSKYKYTEDGNLKILKFETMTEEWINFIVNCRNGVKHYYDIVEGPMADEKLFFFVDDFIRGKIPSETFWSYVKFQYPMHQLSFHTLDSLDCLEFIESYEVNKNGI